LLKSIARGINDFTQNILVASETFSGYCSKERPCVYPHTCHRSIFRHTFCDRGNHKSLGQLTSIEEVPEKLFKRTNVKIELLYHYLHFHFSMDSRLKQLERKQKLYSMLKAQHEAEIKELMHYMSLLTTVENNLVRSYVHTLLTDGLRHIEYISRIMAEIEGATGSASLTKKGIAESIKDERESRDILLECAELASDDTETAALLKSISVDEEHHVHILEHLSELVEASK